MDVRGRSAIRRVVNVFGAVGYSLLAALIMIVVARVLVQLVGAGTVPSAVHGDRTSSPVVTLPSPSLLELIGQSMMLGAAAGALLFLMAALPYWLGRGMSRMMKCAVRWCGYTLTLRSLLFGKLLACGVVMVAAIMTGGQLALILSVGLMSVLVALIFLIQHYLAVSSEVVETKDVW